MIINVAKMKSFFWKIKIETVHGNVFKTINRWKVDES